MIDACLPRSPDNLLDVVRGLKVETAEKYRKRDVTGDGKPETFCNLFLHDATVLLECPVPLMLANDQLTWLDAQGVKWGWGRVDLAEAQRRADNGCPVVVGWRNPAGHGHIALAVPTPPGEDGLHVAQAGSINFTQRPVGRGFGLATPVHFWAHE